MKETTPAPVLMVCFDEVIAERAKIAALENLLAEACIRLKGILHRKSLRWDGGKHREIHECSPGLRDWWGKHRAKQKRESEANTSGEAGKV